MNPQRLENALSALGAIIDRPHFKTKAGMKFTLAEINDALGFIAAHGEKAILCP